MKDSTDNTTTDLFGEKRPRGRPKTGTAKTGAERQAAYRAKQLHINVTVTINRELLELLDAQMQAIKNGLTVQLLSQEQARDVLLALRTAQAKQLRKEQKPAV